MKTKNILVPLAGLLLTGCMAGPDFRPPVVDMPIRYAGTYDVTEADLRWWTIFSDTTLYRLVTTALANNRDVASAYSRVEQARLNMRATRADLFPSLGYSLKVTDGNETELGRTSKPVQEYDVGGSIGWELDFFGKIRRATEAARDQLYATDYGRQSVILSLIAQVADTYFTLLEYERSLSVAEETYRSRTDSLRLIRPSYERGAVSGHDLRQGEQLQAVAAAAIPQYERAVIQTNYALSTLLGQNPGIVVGRHASLLQQPIPADIPAGLPADLLKRRPDIMEAYYTVATRNAMIGVAQASRFPSITLTGDGGLVNTELRHLLRSKSLVWSAAATITGPIFEFGKNKRQVEIAREETRQALLAYEQNVLEALQEVSDALTAVATYREQMYESARMLEAAREAQRLSNERYRRGYSSYLEVLDADRSLFQAELEYSQVVQARLSAYVDLYKALGGGWPLPGESLNPIALPPVETVSDRPAPGTVQALPPTEPEKRPRVETLRQNENRLYRQRRLYRNLR